MRIPEVRAELLEIAEFLVVHFPHHAKRLRQLVEEMKRRPAHRGRRTARPVHEVEEEIRTLHADHPEMSGQEIAHELGISSGRPSEVLHGKRT